MLTETQWSFAAKVNLETKWKQRDDEIIFHKGFCEEVLQVSYGFFTGLFAVLTSEEEGDF